MFEVGAYEPLPYVYDPLPEVYDLLPEGYGPLDIEPVAKETRAECSRKVRKLILTLIQ